MQGDKERTVEHRSILEKMVREAFPDKEINILTEKVAKEEYPWETPTEWRIRIMEPEKPRRRIVLFPTEELMANEGIPFIEIFEEAIKFAKQKLNFPQGGFLGTILLTTIGLEFHEPKKEF